MRLFIVIGGLLVALLSAVLIAPLFIDWTAFRADFEREASRVLGQPVRVMGDAEARLLPFPSLTFTDVVVGETGAEPSMTLARFRMDAELAPYLSGEIRIFQMRLEEPHLRIPVDAEGEPDDLPTLSTLSGSTVVLENVLVSGGRISLRNAETGRSRELTGIDARLSAQTLSGPFSGGGNLRLEGEPLAFTLSSGRIEQSGRWPLRLSLSSERLGASFAFDGATVFGDGAADFAGRFELLSQAREDEDGAALLPRVRVSSDIEISRRKALFSGLRAEVGEAERPYVLTGEGTFDIADVPHFDLTLRGEQVDVDRLAGEVEEGASAPGFADRAEAVRATLAAVPRIDIPGRIDLTLPIVTAGDTVVRDLRFSGSPSGSGWAIRDLSAELPGQTLIEASGLLGVREELTFSGDLLVAARQPGRFSTWLTGAAAPELASLNRAGFSARADLSGEVLRLEDLEVDVGGQRITGRLERSGEPGARLVSADLGGGAVDLNAFLAFARLFTGGSEIFEPVETLDLRFDAGPVAYDGLGADQLSLDFSFGDGLLDLRDLIVENLEGANIDARGTVADLTEAPRPDLVADIASPSPERLVAFLDRQFPGSPYLALLKERASGLSPLSLTLSAASPLDMPGPSVELRLEGSAGGTEVSLTSALAEGLGAPRRGGRYGAELTLSSEEPAALLNQLGFRGLDLGLPGALTVTVSLSGEGAGPLRLSAAARAVDGELTAEGTLTPGASGVEAGDLDWRTRSDDAALWLTAAGAAFGQGLDALPVDLSGRLSFSPSEWRLADVAGSVAGASVETSLGATQGASIVGDLRLGELSLPWLATLVAAVSPELPGEAGLWPAEPFGTPLMPPRGFAVQLAADRLDLGNGDALTGVTGRLEGARDRLRLGDASAEIAGGRLTGHAELVNAGGFGSAALGLSLEDARLAEDAVLSGLLSGTLSVEGSGRSFAEIAASMTGEGRLRIGNASLAGVAPGRFAAILGAADADGFEIASDPVSGVVEDQDEGARYPLGDVEAPVAVALGLARAMPVTVENEGERLTLSGVLDLRTGRAEGAASLAFIPEEDERIEDAAPEISYALREGENAAFALVGVEPLTSYLSLRAYAREQERLEAMREELRETVRLRREARLYRAREAERERIEAERLAAEEAERARLEAEAEAERQRIEAERQAEAERQRAADAERQRAAEAARQAAENAPLRPSAPPAASSPADSAPLDFDLTPRAEPAAPQRPAYEGLPGVSPPLEF